MNRSQRRRELGQHECDLRRNSESGLKRLPPNAKLISRLIRSFQKLIIVSEDHPYTKYYLRSRAIIAFEKKRHGSGAHWWIIHPCSRFRFLWDKLMTVVLLYFFIVIPYVKSFFRICNRGTTHQYYLTYPAYSLCLLDIIVNFITGYASGNGIFLDPTLIARHYSQGFFLLDLITSISYTWFTDGSLVEPGVDVNFLALIAEVIPLLKIIRITTLRRYVKQINAAYGWSSVTDIIIWLSLLTLLIFHWSACLTWAFPFVVLHATRTEIQSSDIIVVLNDIYQADIGTIYLNSIHRGLSNLVGSNFIELRELSHADKLIRCFLLLFGTGYTIYLIVVVLQLVESSVEPKLKYQQIMHRVKEYSFDKNLPKNLEKKLITYYEYRFQGSFFKEQTIATTLPNHLKQEINVRSNRGLVEIARIFDGLPKSLVVDILTVVKPVIYLQDEIVYKYGSEGDCMYFIASGTVAIMNFRGKEIAHLEDGNHFGEITLLHSERRRVVTAIAIETCELLRLERRHFSRLVPMTSELYKRLVDIVEKRLSEVEFINRLSDREDTMKKRRSSEFRRLLMRTGDISPP